MNEYVRRSIESLRTFPGHLLPFVRSIDPSLSQLRPTPTSWSVTEIIGHLGDAERVMRGRIHQICTSDHPVIEPFDQDAAVSQNGYRTTDFHTLLDALCAERTTTMAYLDGLAESAFSRTGWHQDVGLLRVDMMIEYLAKHDYEHYRHIHQILRLIEADTTLRTT